MDLIRERILLADSNRRDMIEVAIDDVDNLCRGFLETLFHSETNLAVLCFLLVSQCLLFFFREVGIAFLTCLRFWPGAHDLDNPLFPAYLVLGAAKEVRLLPLCLAELQHDLDATESIVAATSITRWRCFQRSYYGGRALVYERLEVDVLDYREGEIEDVAAHRGYREEVAVEEDGVEYAWTGSALSLQRSIVSYETGGVRQRTFGDILRGGRVGEYLERVLRDLRSPLLHGCSKEQWMSRPRSAGGS